MSVKEEKEEAVEIKFEDDVEGEHIGTDDYCFVPVGEPVSIVSGDHSEYDSQDSLPLRPLAVSEEFGVLFVAHSNGFFVARTKEVIQTAKEIKEKKSGLSIKESCIIDVVIGKVYILALSVDSSTLATLVAGDIHFFSVNALLNKEQNPYFSTSLGDSSSIRDMQWTNKRTKNQYVILSDQRKLYYGVDQDPLKHVMDNVDAVQWSVNGKFLAVATENFISILSSKFKKKISMSLSFKTWVDDSGFEGTIKVDSIRWIRPDCIVLGCFQLGADGTETDYLIQVVTSKHGKITDASSEQILLSFSYVFDGLVDDIVPYGSGPYMSLGYVANCELAIVANRKNTDQHIVLLGWPQENEKQVAVIDILRDTLRPKISLQENGDDNIVLGLCLDKVTYNDKVEVVLGADYKELSPFCLLLCLSLDGKLSMFQVASATGVSSLSGDASFLSEEEVDDSPTAVFSENGSSDYSDNSPTESAEQDYLGIQIQSPEVNKKEPCIGEGQFPLKETNLEESSNFTNSKNLLTDEESKFSLTKQIQHTTGKQSPFLAKQGTDARQLSQSASQTTASIGDPDHTGKQEQFAGFNSQFFPTNSSTSLFSQTSCRNLSNENDSVGNFGKAEKEKRLGGFSSQSFRANSATSLLSQSTNLFPPSAIKTLSSENNLNKEISEKQLGSATLKAAEERRSFPTNSYSPSSFLPSGYNQPNSPITSSTGANLQGASFGSFSNTKSSALPANHKSTLPFQNFASPNYSSKDQRFVEKDTNRFTSSGRVLSSEPRFPKQSGNVEEMIKELEELLERVVEPGGYREACTVLLEGSVLDLEKGMGTLFGRWRQGKRIMDEQLVEVQSFRDKTVQVAAKKFYMEGIIKQASDGQYWDLCNKQKLSPELELKRQHILKVNQDLTSQLIELERHLNTLEIKAFGEDRGQMRQRGLPARYGSSRHGQSLRSLQEITSSQLATAEQLSESLSRQMKLLSVESSNSKKADARRELFEEIGIPYNNASFVSPEKERAIDNTPSNKVLEPLNSDAKSSSRRNQLTAVKILGCESSRRRRDSLDRSWVSFEPPKTTVKRETRRTQNVDRSSFLMEKTHMKAQMMDRSAFATPELRTTPLTTLQSSNDIDTWERTSKQAFETSSALPQAYKTPDFSKSLSEQTFSLSRNTNETKSSDNCGTSKDVPNKFQPDNATNKTKSQGGLFPSSSQFSIFGSSSSLNSSSVPSTTLVPSISPLSPAVSTNISSSFKLGSNVTQPVAPSLSPESSATVFKGLSFTLNSSFSVPSTSPAPSIAPSSPTISFGKSFSTLIPSTTDSKAVLPSLSISSPPLFGKPVSSLTSTPSPNLPNESLEKEPQPPKPEDSNKVEDNGSSIPSSIPTSEASTLFQSVKNPSLNSTDPDVQDASNSVLDRKITKDVVSLAVPSASEIEKIENQEDDMEEEAPETNLTNQLNLGGLGGFGLGSLSNSNTPKQNPFGSSFGDTVPTPILSPMPIPSGELFRPPSFSLSPPTQPPQPTGGFGAFSGNSVQAPTQSGGFGQPSKIGAGQQALGSLLGSFGQSRQFVAPTPSPVGGFGGGSSSSPPSGGFAGIASGGGGFASLASGGGGFAGAAGGSFSGAAGGGFGGAASPSVGGFGGAATPNVGGFASSAGGFAGAAPGGGGFGGAAPGGGFGSFNSQQGSGGFSSFGNNAGGTGAPPSALFTQMRK